jgi:hypothetical protein
MTECSGQAVRFSSLGRRRVEANWDGGPLASDGGAVLLREVDRGLGLIGAINRCIADPRDPRRIVHDQETLLRQRVFGIALGYEDLNDHTTLRTDPVLQLVSEQAVDEDEPLGSAPTLCRLENRVTRDEAFAINRVFVEQFIASHATPPPEVVLDFDATDDPLHGGQEKRFFHGYYDAYCYLPLYVFCGEQLLVAYLRPSKIDAPKHSWAILSWLVRRFREAWPDVRIVMRADSGFCRWRMLRWCDRHNVRYIIGLAKNAVLTRRAAPLAEQAKAACHATGEKQRLFGEIPYAAETWDRTRRVIVKAEHLPDGPNTRFVVTNQPGDPQHLYDRVYCQRGEMENRIKEQQLDLFADRTSCHGFAANQFRLLLSSAAYVLVEALRRLGLSGTEFARAQAGTIRERLFKIGVRVRATTRRIVLYFASGYPWKTLFEAVVARLRQTLFTPPSAVIDTG